MSDEAKPDLLAKYLAARGSDDPTAAEILLEFSKLPANERHNAYAEVLPMYSVADEYGLACDAVTSAYVKLMDLQKADPSLSWLSGKMGAVDVLALDVLETVDHRLEYEATELGLDPEDLWPHRA